MKLKYAAAGTVPLQYVAACVCVCVCVCTCMHANVNQFDFMCDMKIFTVSHDNT